MFPNIITKQQQGEEQVALILGGSSQLNCKFVVDASNADGLGLKSFSGSGIASVFMHSTASFTGDTHTSTLLDAISIDTALLAVGMPVQGSGIAAGTTIAAIVSSSSVTLSAATSTSVGTGTITYQGVGSPNPAAGLIAVKLSQPYAGFLGFSSRLSSPNSGTPINVTDGVTAGLAYVITSLGNTSAAQWLVLGLPAGVTPAVGVVFVAPLTTTCTGTAQIQIPLAAGAGASHLELIGDSSLSANVVGGSLIYLRVMGLASGALTMNSYTPAGTNNSATPPIFTGTPAVLTGSVANGAGLQKAPADGTLIGLNFSMAALGPVI